VSVRRHDHAVLKEVASPVRDLHGRSASEEHICLTAEKRLAGKVDRYQAGGARRLHVDARASEIEFVGEACRQVVLVIGDHELEATHRVEGGHVEAVIRVQRVAISPLRTDSLPLVSKIYWRQSADDAMMYGP